MPETKQTARFKAEDMTERLIDAAVEMERSRDYFVQSSARELSRAREAIETALYRSFDALTEVKRLYSYTGADADDFAAEVERDIDAALASLTEAR